MKLQQSLRSYKAIEQKSDLPKSTQILLYERQLLTQEIENLSQDLEKSPAFDDPVVGRVKAERALATSILEHRQLIAEMKQQIGILDLKCENSSRDLSDLKEIGFSLESKIGEKREAIEMAPRSEVEKRKQKVLAELDGQAKKLTKTLFRFVEKHYPAKSLQSVSSCFSRHRASARRFLVVPCRLNKPVW